MNSGKTPKIPKDLSELQPGADILRLLPGGRHARDNAKAVSALAGIVLSLRGQVEKTSHPDLHESEFEEPPTPEMLD